MDLLCRLCGSETLATTSAFAIHKHVLIIDMISIVCPIKIEPSDNLPKGICELCLKIVTDAYELRKKSVQNDYYLRNETFTTQTQNIVHIKVEKDPFSVRYQEDPYNPPDNEDDNDFQQSDDDEEDDDDGDSNFEITSFEPKTSRSSRKRKTESPGGCNNCGGHFQYREVNERVKQYFKRVEDSHNKWLCKTCNKEYTGSVSNLKDHMIITHPEIAKKLNVIHTKRVRIKKKSKQDEKVMLDKLIPKKLLQQHGCEK